MRKIVYIFAAIAAVAAVGCQKFEKETVVKTRTLVCSFDATKTTLDDNGRSPKWAVGDQIKLIDATGSEEVTLTPDDIKDEYSRIEIETTLQGETIYAVYPASAAVSTSVTNDIVEFTTAGQDGSFAKANICVAKEDKGTLSFQNATAIVNIHGAATAKTNYYALTATSGSFDDTIAANFASGFSCSTSVSGSKTLYTKGDNLTKPTGGKKITWKEKYAELAIDTDDYYIAVPDGTKCSFTAKRYTKQSSKGEVQNITTFNTSSTLTATRGKLYTVNVSFN